MRAAWVRPGGGSWPDEKKMARYGINQLFYDPDDPQVTAQHFDALRAHGYRPGIMRGPTGGVDAYAQKLSEDLDRLGSANKTCTVCADIEGHDPAYVVAWLDTWRKMKPTRATIWTLEPWQAGWFTPALVQRINADPNLIVSPQLYLGDMTPQVESEVACQLVSVGVHWDRVRCFYDASKLPAAWDGIAFDLASAA